MGVNLLVYVPGLDGDPAPLRRLAADLGESWRAEVSPVRVRPWDRRSAGELARELSSWIARIWWEMGGLGRVVLVGHSVGGLLVRHAYLIARGDEDSRETKAWAGRVSRIVLLAAPNRGVDARRLALTGRAMADLRRGAPYLTDLRVRWLDHFDRTVLPPRVVQLLGTGDTLVTRDDSLDVEQFANARHVTVPGADHHSLRDHHRLIWAAVAGPGLPTTPILGVEPRTVVFLTRSRDRNWQALRRALAGRADVRAVPAHGFLDEYGQVYARHRHGAIHFAGLGRGAGVLGRALAAVPALAFGNVYLAGSALPGFPWRRVLEREQVGKVRDDGDLSLAQVPEVVAYLSEVEADAGDRLRLGGQAART
ncbi:hypothetical protein Aph01nite_21200 [Acrocarpospora phusangensis]|uniref:Uncharacterized protein n=1 Tax=Acrocarpospora phusangensis TaxID=1070424 RepID=A0A919UPN8_9ACTN|nr:hypothetical protein [Acrocarpospora phusangensis]GIH23810.1 hypothetical protein Aph01nite_21200 [Acrocarpospora phusangensis]